MKSWCVITTALPIIIGSATLVEGFHTPHLLKNFSVKPTTRNVKTLAKHKVPQCPPLLRLKADDKESNGEVSSVFQKFVVSVWKGMALAFPKLLTMSDSAADIPSASKIFSVRESLLAIVSYLIVGVGAYSFLFEKWSIVDSLYFSVVSFTTVGYGDLCPTTKAGKIFTCFYGLSGVVFLGLAIASIGASFVQAELDALQQARRASLGRVLQLFDNMPSLRQSNSSLALVQQASPFVESTLADKKNPVIRFVAKFMTVFAKKVLPAMLLLVMGGMYMGRIEGWNLIDSLYYSIITCGTLGYGDFSPGSQRGRLWGTLFIPLAVAGAGEVLGSIASVLVEQKERAAREAILNRDLTMESLEAMDVNCDGKVTESEYVEFMLVEMGLAEAGELADLHKQFKRLDVTRTGYLDGEDLRLMAEINRRQLREELL